MSNAPLSSPQLQRLSLRIADLAPLARRMFSAVVENDPGALDDALEAGADCSRRLPGGSTALMLACSLGREQCAQILARRGGPLHLLSRDDSGANALHKAASWGQMACAQALLSQPGAASALLGSRDRQGRTPLMRAALRGDGPMALLLLEGSDPCAQDGDGSCALHLAAQSGEASAVEPLLALYPVDVRNALGETALHCACAFGRPHTAALLAFPGCELSLDFQGRTPLESLCSGAPTPAPEAIRSNPKDSKPDEIQCCKWLIARGADLSRQDANGMGPLDWACLMNKPALAFEIFDAIQAQGLDAKLLAERAGSRAESSNHGELAAELRRRLRSWLENQDLLACAQGAQGDSKDSSRL